MVRAKPNKKSVGDMAAATKRGGRQAGLIATHPGSKVGLKTAGATDKSKKTRVQKNRRDEDAKLERIRTKYFNHIEKSMFDEKVIERGLTAPELIRHAWRKLKNGRVGATVYRDLAKKILQGSEIVDYLKVKDESLTVDEELLFVFSNLQQDENGGRDEAGVIELLGNFRKMNQTEFVGVMKIMLVEENLARPSFVYVVLAFAQYVARRGLTNM